MGKNKKGARGKASSKSSSKSVSKSLKKSASTVVDKSSKTEVSSSTKRTVHTGKPFVSHRGEVYRGNTKYIDVEPKEQRNYVVVADNGERISVSKLKSIKKLDESGRNADEALVEINSAAYGLGKRTGVDYQKFSSNRMSGKPLRIEDSDVFPEGKPSFRLGSHDLHRVLFHVNKKKGK